MKTIVTRLVLLGLALSALNLRAADGLDPAAQAKVDAKLKEIQTWAADAAIVQAVKTHNTSLPAEAAAMTQDKWKTLPILDPYVRSFNKNASAEFLKGKKGDVVTEAFVSGADGLKVAFLTKPSGWSHKGKAKLDDPMAGKTWQGSVEVDESTGIQQVQVAVPVLDGTTPIGSLVVGLSLSKLN